MTSKLNDIQTAIDNFQMDEARQLLREELQDNPTAEGYYLASQAAQTHGQRIKFLEKTIELDPFHEIAHEELDSINAPLRDDPVDAPTPAAEQQSNNPPVIQLASISQRFFAFLIDTLIFGFISAFIAVTFGPPIPFDTVDEVLLADALTELQGVASVVSLIVSAIYFVYFVPRMNGQTPGKRMLGIRAVKIDGTPFTIMDVILRHVIGYNLSSIFALGFIWAMLDSKRQGWHDKIVGSMVIVDPK